MSGSTDLRPPAGRSRFDPNVLAAVRGVSAADAGGHALMSMIRPPLESLLEKADNKYALVIGVAKRARQLKEGHLPMVDIGSTNPVTVALEEIAAGKVRTERPAEPAKT